MEYKKMIEDNAPIEVVSNTYFIEGAKFLLPLLEQKDSEIERLKGGGWHKTLCKKPIFGYWVLCYCAIYGYYIGCFEQILDTGYGQWCDGKTSGILPPIAWMYLPNKPAICE